MVDWSNTSFIASQTFMLVGFLLLAVTFFINNRKLILVLVLILMCCLAVGYAFLSAWVGLGMYSVLIIRAVFDAVVGRKKAETKEKVTEVVANTQKAKISKSDYLMLGVWSSALLCIAVLTAKEFLAWFAFFATLTFLVSLWQKDVKIYRWLSVLVSVFWIVYNSYVENIVGVIMRIGLLGIGIIGVIMLFTAQKNKQTIS